jgi:hypothetical protein
MPLGGKWPGGKDLARTDRRWLLTVTAVFVATVGSLLGVREIYRATGPHPELIVFVRRVKFYANSLLRQGRLKRSQR